MDYGSMLPSIEVLIVNLVVLDRCLRRKRSIFKIAAVLLAFTALFVLGFSLLPSWVLHGSGELSVLGFAYLVPLKLLYDEKMETLFLVACMSWTYALGILSISVQATSLLGSLGFGALLFVIEAVLFLVTFEPVKRCLVPRYSYIIRSGGVVQEGRFVHFKISIYVNFFMLIVLHLVFLDGERYVLQIAVLVMFLALNYFFYHIVYEIICGSLKINKLEIAASSDVLTGIGNRAQAMEDMRRMMVEQREFSIAFLDLDGFKFVNDRYGHDTGDRYLIHFADVFSKALGERGKLYRHGGDEFLAIYRGVLAEETLDEMAKCAHWREGAPCEFNGVSVGLVVCEPPYADGDQDDFLQRADGMMYRNKAGKKASDLAANSGYRGSILHETPGGDMAR